MKTRHMTTKIILLSVAAAVVALWGVSHAAPTADVLDGKTFTCPTGNMGMKAYDKDELSFKDGKLHSALFEKWGFSEGAYSSTVKGDEIHFKAETSSQSHGKIVWKGKVSGEGIDIAYNWISQDWHWKDHHGASWCRGPLKN